MKLITLCLLSAIATTALAAEENPDVIFFRKAAESDLAQVSGAELAQQQARTAALRGLAATMGKEHAAALATLESLAAGKEIELPMRAGPAQQGKLSSMRALSGAQFDKTYVEWQIGTLRDAIVLYRTESSSGDDLDARQFAIVTLPTLQSDLDRLLAIVLDQPPAPPAPDPAVHQQE